MSGSNEAPKSEPQSPAEHPGAMMGAVHFFDEAGVVADVQEVVAEYVVAVFHFTSARFIGRSDRVFLSLEAAAAYAQSLFAETAAALSALPSTTQFPKLHAAIYLRIGDRIAFVMGASAEIVRASDLIVPDRSLS